MAAQTAVLSQLLTSAAPACSVTGRLRRDRIGGGAVPARGGGLWRRSEGRGGRTAAMAEARLGSGGAGVLEKPGLEQSGGEGGPSTEEGGEMGKLRQRIRNSGGNRYRVLLLDHERHTEAYVAKVLPTAVPDITENEARGVFHESRQLGAGLVIVVVKEHAEFYAQMMARKGLRSTIEPDGAVL